MGTALGTGAVIEEVTDEAIVTMIQAAEYRDRQGFGWEHAVDKGYSYAGLAVVEIADVLLIPLPTWPMK
jgi:hypothetical protein